MLPCIDDCSSMSIRSQQLQFILRASQQIVCTSEKDISFLFKSVDNQRAVLPVSTVLCKIVEMSWSDFVTEIIAFLYERKLTKFESTNVPS